MAIEMEQTFQVAPCLLEKVADFAIFFEELGILAKWGSQLRSGGTGGYCSYC